MPNLLSTYEPWAVAASVLVAALACYVALDLARRVPQQNRARAWGWWISASAAMGTGIWCMHFIGMLGFSLPIPLGFSSSLTFASWLAAVAASAVALFVASRGSLNGRRLCAGAAAMATGICAMHYIGMASLGMAPRIVWDMLMVAMSIGIAVVASAAALLIFFWLRGVSPRHRRNCQSGAAVVMGLAISGMHYTGMAAASFPQGSICSNAGDIRGAGMGILIAGAAASLLVLTLFTPAFQSGMLRFFHAAATRLLKIR